MKINILVLSDQPNERLLAEIEKENKSRSDHEISGSVISPNDLMLQLPDNGSQGKIFKSKFSCNPLSNKPVTMPDDLLPETSAVIPLLDQSCVDLGIDVVRMLDFAGICNTVKAHALENLENQFKTDQLFMNYNLSIINRLAFFASDRYNQVVDMLDGFPIVGKTYNQNNQLATTKISDFQGMAMFLQSSQNSNARFSLSRFINSGESSFSIVKSIILNPFSDSPDFFSCEVSTENFHSQNYITPEIAKAVELKDYEKETVKKAAQIIDAELCQVNFIKDQSKLGGSKIISVQAYPEFEIMEHITSQNIAAKIIGFVINKVIDNQSFTKSTHSLKGQYDRLGMSDKIKLVYHTDWLKTLSKVNKGLRLIKQQKNSNREIERFFPDVTDMINHVQEVVDELESLQWLSK